MSIILIEYTQQIHDHLNDIMSSFSVSTERDIKGVVRKIRSKFCEAGRCTNILLVLGTNSERSDRGRAIARDMHLDFEIQKYEYLTRSIGDLVLEINLTRSLSENIPVLDKLDIQCKKFTAFYNDKVEKMAYANKDFTLSKVIAQKTEAGFVENLKQMASEHMTEKPKPNINIKEMIGDIVEGDKLVN